MVMAENGCIFCAIVEGKISVQKVGENEGALAFHDTSPSADVHVLIVPKVHLGSFLELHDPMTLNLMREVAQGAIKTLKLESGYKLLFNGGSYQHIPHLHWHLLSGVMRRSP
jgi:histidine triad (HIT) family protein